MDRLFSYHDILLSKVPDGFIRFLYSTINWDQRMIAIKGPRGTGKTTLMLQRISKAYPNGSPEVLYVTAEHPYFYDHSLFEMAEGFYNNGGRHLFIDEVHMYPRWSRELKVIYDGFPDMKVVFSASSALDIYKGEADLSRRVLTYELPGMSLREYLLFAHDQRFDPISLDDLTSKHRAFSSAIADKTTILPIYKEYLKSGYLPMNVNLSDDEYKIKLTQMINTVIDSDLAYIDQYSAGAALKVKKLLGVVAESVPFKPNIAALARKLDMSRDLVYSYLKHLQDAHLLSFLHAQGKGTSTLQKPEKLYLENTNLAYAFRERPDMGNLRETFLLNQLKNAGYEPTAPVQGDFFVPGINLIIEVGGHKKGKEQITGADHAVIAADDILHGGQGKVPLWLFGFLY